MDLCFFIVCVPLSKFELVIHTTIRRLFSSNIGTHNWGMEVA